MVSWAGPTKGMVSIGGSVLPGLVTMALEGEGLAKPNDKAAQYARWFVAHEAAHFWLGQAIAYDTPGRQLDHRRRSGFARLPRHGGDRQEFRYQGSD